MGCWRLCHQSKRKVIHVNTHTITFWKSFEFCTNHKCAYILFSYIHYCVGVDHYYIDTFLFKGDVYGLNQQFNVIPLTSGTHTFYVYLSYVNSQTTTTNSLFDKKKTKSCYSSSKKNSFLNNRSLSLSFTKKYEEWKSHYFVCILIIRGMESTSFQCGFLQPLNSLPIRVIGAIVPDVGRFYFLYIQILLLFFAFWNWVHFTFPYKIFSFQTSTPSQSQLQLQTSSFTITDSVCLFNQPRVNSFVLLYSIHRISLCSFVQWYGRTCQSILFHRSCEFWRIKTTQQSLTQYHRSQHSSPLSGLSYNWIWTIQYSDSQFVYKTKRHGNLLKSLLIFLIFSCN